MKLNEIADRLELMVKWMAENALRKATLLELASELRAMQPVNQQLLDALRALRAAVRDVPEMNGREFVGLGIQVNNAIAAAEAQQAPAGESTGKDSLQVEEKQAATAQEAEPRCAVCAESGRMDIDTDALIYAKLDRSKPTEAAPERIWRARNVDFNKTATVNMQASDVRMFQQCNPDFIVQFSDNSGATWQNVPEGK